MSGIIDVKNDSTNVRRKAATSFRLTRLASGVAFDVRSSTSIFSVEDGSVGDKGSSSSDVVAFFSGTIAVELSVVVLLASFSASVVLLVASFVFSEAAVAPAFASPAAALRSISGAGAGPAKRT